MRYRDGRWPPYVSVEERRVEAARQLARRVKRGLSAAPVVIEGRTIARTFWGRAWCANLERYSDFSNRLPRGRSYVRGGAVVDLQIAPGKVVAQVAGSVVYEVVVEVAKVPARRWASICADCAGAIGSVVELLQGRLSRNVMERICQAESGLFPSPTEIRFSCTCPDWASMCKHVAAVFYGIGARLDLQPDLLFTLRTVKEQDLISRVGKELPQRRRGPAKEKILGSDGLSELFGLDLDQAAKRRPSAGTRSRPPKVERKMAAKKKLTRKQRKPIDDRR